MLGLIYMVSVYSDTIMLCWFFFFKQKTAYEMRISDWSSDVCSSDLLDAVKGVVTTMIQTEKYGTPLASALRVLSAEFRNERMMRAEEKAARLPAIMTIPLILFILPTLFVVILGRSEERRVGKECVSTCGSRGSPDH